jgi:hypothetical protein
MVHKGQHQKRRLETMKCRLGIAGVKAAWGVITMGQRIVRFAERIEANAGEPYTVRCNFAWRLMTLGERVEAFGEALEARADRTCVPHALDALWA